MQKRHASLWLIVPAILTCLFALFVSSRAQALIIQPQNLGGSNFYDALGTTGLYASQKIGAGFSGDVTQIGAGVGSVGNPAGSLWTASLECFTDDFYLTSCGSSGTSTPLAIANGSAPVWATTTISSFTLYPSNTYMIHYHVYGVNGSDNSYLWGTASNDWTGGDAVLHTGHTTGTVVDLAFSLDGSGFFAPAEGISYGDYNATSTSDTALFQDTASSTLAVIAARCAGTNVFAEALCATFSFLFIPSTEVLDGFTGIPAVAATRFPFSWISGMKTTIDGMSVSSTTAMTALAYNFHDLGIGSSTPMGNILPNMEVFSKNTIETYISPSLWATFQTLIAAGMWLGFFFFEFNRARGMAKKH